jgi:hypothetical protein
MTFPVVGSNIPSAYQISNSLRFNQSDDPSLTRTPASVSNRRTFTWSGWVKRSKINATRQLLFGADNSADTNATYIRFTDDETIQVYIDNNNVLEGNLNTSAKFRDVSAWYHIVWAVDTTQSTSSDRVKVYINNSLVTTYQTPVYPSQNFDTNINTQEPHYVGGDTTGVANDFALDGYMAETYFIDGQALSPTDFGEFDEDSGVWKPKQYAGTYGTNGFYLKFNNTGNMGEDSSGNDNTFTPTNLSGTTDVTTDTPTNNFATGNPLARSRFSNQGTISEGNLKYNALSNDRGWLFSSQGISQGKWYWEVKITAIGRFMVGVGYESVLAFNGTFFGNNPSKAFSILDFNGNLYYDGTNTSYGSSLSVDDIVMVALDMDNHLCWFGKNGTWFDSATQSEIENSTATNDATTQMGTQQNLNSGEPVFPFMTCQENGQTGGGIFNFGNPPFSISSGNSDDNGYGNFEYEVPTGYLSLCSANLATELSPTIDDGSEYFNTVLYTGNGGTNAVTGVGFKPDWIWVKERSSTSGHRLADTTRGATKSLSSNDTGSETTNANIFSSLDSDGFTQGADNGVNESGQTYASWNWKANAGSTSSNTDGSITSTVQANTTAGFSIVTYTGNGTSGATIGHGLGVQPSMVMVKARNVVAGWYVEHIGLTGFGTRTIFLNETSAESSQVSHWNNTAPTSSVFTVGNSGGVNQNTKDYIAYCFHSVEGYSKFGKYTGNGSTDGTFVYTGFRPSFVLTKRTDTNGYSWGMVDSKRSPYNQANEHLFANASDAEYTTLDKKDLLSNGFKHRTNLYGNLSGGTYIYMAFAENPFVTSGAVPVTAR